MTLLERNLNSQNKGGKNFNGNQVLILRKDIVTVVEKIKLRSFKSSEHINEKGDGPYRGFGYLSLFSDPINLATWSQRKLL